MKRPYIIVVALACVYGSTAFAYDFAGDWPTKYKNEDGFEFGIKGTYQGDLNNFSNDESPVTGNDVFEDLQTWRRKEFNMYAKKDGVFELTLGYDYQSKLWIDNYFKMITKAGDFRLGQMKTPVSWEEGGIGAGATTFLERALPASAVYEGRRFGLDWGYNKIPNWMLYIGYFGGQDLNGDNDGTTLAGKIGFDPIKTDDQVLHLGFAASREDRDDNAARVRTKPEAGLTGIRLVDSGRLANTENITRYSLEGAWISGPLLVQGEYLGIGASRTNGSDDYSAEGFYVQGSWVLTGETRPYKNGSISNVKPKNPWGAFEVALRYSEVDLNDGAIKGGKEHDWTLGANWYLNQHFKFQANYIRAFSNKYYAQLNAEADVDPSIVEVRAQLSF